MTALSDRGPLSRDDGDSSTAALSAFARNDGSKKNADSGLRSE